MLRARLTKVTEERDALVRAENMELAVLTTKARELVRIERTHGCDSDAFHRCFVAFSAIVERAAK